MAKRTIQARRVNSERVSAQDAFTNPAARIGFGTPSLNEGTLYPLTRLTFNYQLFNSLYRGSWIIQRVINTIPEDMVKNWYDIKSELSPDEVQRVHRAERATRLRRQILDGLRWGFLYGGAAGLIMLEGHEDRLAEPLNLDDVLPDAYKGLLILDRWTGIAADTSELVDDPASAEFGMPKYYILSSDDERTDGARVHYSRIVRFVGCELPYLERVAESYWGESKIEAIFEELKKRDNTSFNIANLVFLANIRTYKMGRVNLANAIGGIQQQRLYDTLSQMNHIMSNMGTVILNNDDDFSMQQYTFTGLSEVMTQFKQDLAGAAEMPLTKLFGMSPAGMNATGESDLQNYYDSLQAKQEAYMRPVLEKLMPVLMMSVLGFVPDIWDIEFNDVRNLTEREKMETAEVKTRIVLDAFGSGLIDKALALKELQQMGEGNNVWTNITDEVVQAAENEPEPDIPDFGGMNDIADMEVKPTRDADKDYYDVRGGNPENTGQFSEEQGSKKENETLTEGAENAIIKKQDAPSFLKNSKTGKSVKVKAETIKPRKKDCAGWELTWNGPDLKGYTIRAIKAEGDNRIQGMIAYKPVKNDSAIYVKLVESAPFNSPHNKSFKEREYEDVGGRLFAEAIGASYDAGFDGVIYFEAKTKLISHYAEKYGAKLVNATTGRMFIDGKEARKIYERYYTKQDG